MVTRGVPSRKALSIIAGEASSHYPVAQESCEGQQPVKTFKGIVSTAVMWVFDLGVARTGLSEKEAQAAEPNVVATKVHSTDQEGYMPDA